MAASWVIPDEADDATASVFRRLKDERGNAPSLFWFEIRQLLLTAERRNRLEQGGALSGAQKLGMFAIEDAGCGLDVTIFRLAGKYALSAHDASYLALALSDKIPLATLDRRLAAAAQAEQVTVLGPLAKTV